MWVIYVTCLYVNMLTQNEWLDFVEEKKCQYYKAKGLGRLDKMKSPTKIAFFSSSASDMIVDGCIVK